MLIYWHNLTYEHQYHHSLSLFPFPPLAEMAVNQREFDEAIRAVIDFGGHLSATEQRPTPPPSHTHTTSGKPGCIRLSGTWSVKIRLDYARLPLSSSTGLAVVIL